MRPTASNIATKGGFGGEKVALSIDLNSMQFIMKHLTDLYSDPMLAVIREYSTNAFDSHVEAGNSSPIQVYTPNRMSPYFVVRDFGVGLDDEGIREVYSKYGASTKRNTNDQIGMLGFGCKAGLTYTDQVVITSWKNGKKYSSVLSRDKDGSASIQIVDVADSSEPTGVEIKIMVKDAYSFNEKVREFYKFWVPGSVLVDGKTPEGFNGMEKLAEGIYMDPNTRGDYVVMGNVPYQQTIPTKIARGYRYNHSVVVVAPVGSVEFTPSREHLNMTPETTKWVQDAGKRFDAALEAKINREIGQAATPSKAIAAADEWQRKLGAGAVNATYKGKAIPFTFYLEDPNPVRIGNLALNRGDTSGRMFALQEFISGDEYVSVEQAISYNTVKGYTPKEAVIITGWEMKKLTSLHVRKVRMYLEKLGLVQAPNLAGRYGKTVTVFVSRNPKVMEGGWLDEHVTHISWADITSMKLPRQPKAAKPTVYIHTINSAQLDYVDDSKPLFYKTNGWNGHSSKQLTVKSWLFSILPQGSQLAVISERRVNSFMKKYPKAVRINDHLSQQAKSYVASLSQEVLDKLTNSTVTFRSVTEKLDYRKVADPDLAKELRLTKENPKGWDTFLNNREAFAAWGIVLNIPGQLSKMTMGSKYESRYPLLVSLTWSANPTDVLEYIELVYNKKYATHKKGN